MDAKPNEKYLEVLREQLTTVLAVHAESGHAYRDRYDQAEIVVDALEKLIRSIVAEALEKRS